jgi:AmiR/NasT family two-component response regulator
MAHHRITQGAAFGLLRATRQQLQRKLRDIAERVVETGSLPPGAPVEPEP